MFKTLSCLSFKQCELKALTLIGNLFFVKERLNYKVFLPPVKISLDIPNILCYTFQFVRRFCSEEPNYTPTREKRSMLSVGFFGEIRHVAVG